MVKVTNRQQRKFFKNENIEFPKTVTLTHPKISVEGNQFCFQWRTFACCVIHNWEFHKKKKKGTETFEANSDFSVFYLWKEGRGNFL